MFPTHFEEAAKRAVDTLEMDRSATLTAGDAEKLVARALYNAFQDSSVIRDIMQEITKEQKRVARGYGHQ